MQREIRKKVIKWVSLLAVVVVSGTMIQPNTVRGSQYDSKIQDAKDAKAELEKKKAELKNKLASLEAAKSNVVDYIEKLDKELAELQDQIDELELEIKTVEDELEQTKKELEKAKETEANQYATMKKRIQYMYENQNTSFLDVLLSSDSIADFLNQVEYVEQITEYDNSLLAEYKATKEKVEQMEAALSDSLEEKNALNEEMSANQDALEKLMSDKQTELKKYEKKIDSAETKNSDYEAQIAAQEQEIEDLLLEQQKAIIAEEKRKAEEEKKRKEEEERKKREEEEKKQQAANSSSSSSSGSSGSSNTSTSASGFTWPVPSSSYISCGFGYRDAPTAGASTYHQGIDIGAPTGATIVAAKGGTVVKASYSVGSGNYVMINHGDGVFTIYMHCSKLLVSQGQTVSRGQSIALVGSTGISTGPHLHFGVSVNGSYVDPRKYVNP